MLVVGTDNTARHDTTRKEVLMASRSAVLNNILDSKNALNAVDNLLPWNIFTAKIAFTNRLLKH